MHFRMIYRWNFHREASHLPGGASLFLLEPEDQAAERPEPAGRGSSTGPLWDVANGESLGRIWAAFWAEIPVLMRMSLTD